MPQLPEKGARFRRCRCQAFLMPGDAANATPVCDLSPHHHLVTEAGGGCGAAALQAEEPRPAEEQSPSYFAHRRMRLRCFP